MVHTSEIMLYLRNVMCLITVLTIANLVSKVRSQSFITNSFRFHSDVGYCTRRNKTNFGGSNILPTITCASKYIQQTVTPEHVVISGFDISLHTPELVAIACYAPYPVEIIYDDTNSTLITYPTSKYQLQSTIEHPLPFTISYTEGETKYEHTQYNTRYVTWVYVNSQYIRRYQQMRLQCNSVKKPCLGKVIVVSFDPTETTLTIKSTNIEVTYEAIFPNKITKDQSISRNQNTTCKAKFYHIITRTESHLGFPFPVRAFACELENGKPGNASVINTYTTSVVHNSFKNIDVQPSKCWNFIRNANEELNACANCTKTFWRRQFPIILICADPNRTIENLQQQKSEFGSYMIFGLNRKHLLGDTENYLIHQNIRIDSIILVTIVHGDQVLNSTITVQCKFHGYYFGGTFGFAEEYKGDSDGDGNQVFISRPLIRENLHEENVFETSNMVLIKSTNLERVYCLGHLQREGKWVNVSLAINISQPLYPAFINTMEREDGTKQDPMCLNKENKQSATSAINKIYFNKNDINKNITCEVVGRPFPNISWTRFDNAFKETRRGLNTIESFPYSWSEIHFKQITPSTGGDYVCRAYNNLGQVRKVFRVIINDSSSSQTAVIAVSVVVVGIFLALAAVFFIQLRKIRKQRQVIRNLTQEEIQEFFDGNPNMNENDPHFSVFSQAFNPEFNVLKDHLILNEGKLLGCGHFGTVTQGYLILNQGIPVSQDGPSNDLSSKLTVAVKTVKSNVDVIHVKSLLSEIKIMAYLDSHPNIVQLLGTVTENIQNNEILMAVEFCGNGDLKKYLETHRAEFKNIFQMIKSKTTPYENVTASSIGTDSTLSVEYQNVPGTQLSKIEPKRFNYSTHELLRWAKEIANGMSYLSQKRIIHGDLAARNILLTDKNIAKISDFGLSRVLRNDYTIYSKKTETPLPWKWLAIESLKCQQFSLKSDVWSFGVVLWEIFSIAQTPYPGLNYDHEFMDKIQQGYRLGQPEFANSELYDTMIGCWDKDPEQRPDIHLVSKILVGFAHRLTQALTS